MTQYRRAIAAFADGNALIDWPRPSKARGRALISAVLAFISDEEKLLR